MMMMMITKIRERTRVCMFYYSACSTTFGFRYEEVLSNLLCLDDESNTIVLPTSPPTPAKTTWTLLIYLTGPATGCVGGETVFYPELGPAKKFSGMTSEGTALIAVELEVGTALLHKHGQDCLLHEGRKVTKGRSG